MAFDEIHLPVTGMTCANCAANIERAVKKLSGIRDASVNFAAETASIVFDPEAVGLREIVAQIERAGYGAQIPDNAEGGEDAGEAAREAELAAQTVKFFVGLALAVPLFVLSMGRDLGIFGAWAHHWGVNWFFFLLATPVQFYTGFDYYVGAFKSLRNRSANMDVLVAMGSSAAYFYSLAVLVLPHAGDHVYFETAAVIIVLIKLGKILETRAKRKTGGAIRHLLDLRLKTASVIADDREEQVPVDRVAQGDILIVRPGGQIPVDGIITEGRSSVDESMFSGEPLPVDKGPNNEVIGGSINRDGVLTFRATRVGRDTALARIVKLVQDAQGSKAPIQALADRVAAVFVPFVMGVAGVTFLIWWVGTNDFAVGMIRLVAVLVIACPCALGLATPTAMMAGMGKGAEAGILFKTSQALETAARLKTIAM
ncbi:MAG: cation-transporting ATPase PacS, partial [Desulfobacterales bacterium CG23_combo_of_CG06-09_8_20_14_all_51_8]